MLRYDQLSTHNTLGIQTRTQSSRKDAEAEEKDLQWDTLRGQTTNTHHVSSRLNSNEVTEQQKLDIAITDHCSWSFQGGSNQSVHVFDRQASSKVMISFDSSR